MNITVLTPSRYWVKRAQRHLVLAACAVATSFVAYMAVPGNDTRHHFSMATAYSGLVFLVVCLCLGPWNVLTRRVNPVSFDLRRDIGVWAGILALMHTGIGLTVHLRGRMWMYFFRQLHPLRVQNTKFGLANYVGMIAALLFLGLLIISNDKSLRRLKTRRWKSLQRWAYAAAVLTVIHGVLFQMVEGRPAPWLAVFWLIVALALGFQGAGYFAVKRTKSSDQQFRLPLRLESAALQSRLSGAGESGRSPRRSR